MSIGSSVTADGPAAARAPAPPLRARLCATAISHQLQLLRRGGMSTLDIPGVDSRLTRILEGGAPDAEDLADDPLITEPLGASSRGACARAWDAACGVGVAVAIRGGSGGSAQAEAHAVERSRVVLTALIRRVRHASAFADVLSLASANRTWRAAFLTAPTVPIMSALEAAGHPVSTALVWACRTRNTPLLLQLMVDAASVSYAAAAQYAWVAPLATNAVSTFVAYVSAAAGGHADVCAAVLRTSTRYDAVSRLSALGRALTPPEMHGILQLSLLAVAGASDRADARSDATHTMACILVAPMTAALEAAALEAAASPALTHAVRHWVSHVWQAALVSAARSDHARATSWLLGPEGPAQSTPPARRRALYDAARRGSLNAMRVLLPAVLNDGACDSNNSSNSNSGDGAAHVLSQTLARAFIGSAAAVRELLENHARGSAATTLTKALHLCGAAAREVGTTWGRLEGSTITRVFMGWHPPTPLVRESFSGLLTCAAWALRHGKCSMGRGYAAQRTFVVMALASAALPDLARAMVRALWDGEAADRPPLPVEAWLAMAVTCHAHVVDVILDDLREDVDARQPGYRASLTRALWNAGSMLRAFGGNDVAWRATRDRLATLLATRRRCGEIVKVSKAQADAYLLTAAKRGPPGCIEQGLLCPILRAAWRFSTAGIKAVLDVIADKRRFADADACPGSSENAAATAALLDVLSSHVPMMADDAARRPHAFFVEGEAGVVRVPKRPRTQRTQRTAGRGRSGGKTARISGEGAQAPARHGASRHDTAAASP